MKEIDSSEFMDHLVFPNSSRNELQLPNRRNLSHSYHSIVGTKSPVNLQATGGSLEHRRPHSFPWENERAPF